MSDTALEASTPKANKARDLLLSVHFSLTLADNYFISIGNRMGPSKIKD